jgi:hypothetical protein
MSPIKTVAAALLFAFLGACSGLEYEAWPTDEFAAAGYQTYSWRTEPIQNIAGSGDPIYALDPIARAETDSLLQAKGYRRVDWNGDFTVDYIYAPGLTSGVMGEEASIITTRVGVRPNSSVSQAERDNAIALGSGVKETHNLALQLNDGKSRKEVWRGIITKIAQEGSSNKPSRSSIKSGLNKLVSQLPSAS